MMDPGALPAFDVDKLGAAAVLAWFVWKRLEALADSQKGQGKRIGDLEDRVARLEGKGDVR